MVANDVKPIVGWDDKDANYPNIVWSSILDERYLIEVRRIKPYVGSLYIFDHLEDDKLVKIIAVGLSYDAKFGPDSADVYEWQNEVLKIVDAVE